MAFAPGLQINTFALVDKVPDLQSNSFGKTYQDYLDGLVWGRKFVGGGADPNNMHLEFPVLFLEPGEGLTPCPGDEEWRQKWRLLVVDMIACEACPPGIKRNAEIVQANAKLMIRAFLKELYTYALYEIEIDAVTTFQWLSAGRLAYLEGEGATVIDGPLEDMPSVLNETLNENIPIIEWGRPVYDKYIGAFTEIGTTFCESINLDFRYDVPVVEGLATTECPC